MLTVFWQPNCRHPHIDFWGNLLLARIVVRRRGARGARFAQPRLGRKQAFAATAWQAFRRHFLARLAPQCAGKLRVTRTLSTYTMRRRHMHMHGTCMHKRASGASITCWRPRDRRKHAVVIPSGSIRAGVRVCTISYCRERAPAFGINSARVENAPLHARTYARLRAPTPLRAAAIPTKPIVKGALP